MKNKIKMNNKIFGGIILGFIVISLITFSVIQAVYYDYNAPSDYVQTSSDSVNMYNGNTVLLNPASYEVWEFDLYLISTGERLEGGLIQGSAESVGCWWGDDTDTVFDCHIDVRRFHAPVYAYEGQSCSEDWEFCRSGDDTSCVSGICVANDECSIDSECPNGGWDDVAYCDGGDVVRDYLEGDCYFGDCRFVVDKQNIESCDFGCEDGSCLAEVVDPVTPVDPVEPTVTCTDGEFRYTNDLIYVCGVQTPVKEICVSNNWEQVIVKNTNCGVVNETTPVTPLNPTNPECNVGDTQIFTYDINCEGDTSSVVINCVNGVWQKINYEALDCELSWIERVQNGDINISSILITLISGGVVIFLISYLRKNPQILNAIKKSKK